MKTIVIWDSVDSALEFFVLDGDYTKFDKVYIGADSNQELWDELAHLVYDSETGEKLIEMRKDFPITEILFVEDPNQIAVITAGILP